MRKKALICDEKKEVTKMRLTYLKPVLKELSQGARIAFSREFRHLTQDDVAEKIGLNSKARRRTITRYEN